MIDKIVVFECFAGEYVDFIKTVVTLLFKNILDDRITDLENSMWRQFILLGMSRSHLEDMDVP